MNTTTNSTDSGQDTADQPQQPAPAPIPAQRTDSASPEAGHRRFMKRSKW